MIFSSLSRARTPCLLLKSLLLAMFSSLGTQDREIAFVSREHEEDRGIGSHRMVDTPAERVGCRGTTAHSPWSITAISQFDPLADDGPRSYHEPFKH